MAFMPILRQHDHTQVQVYCYSGTASADAITQEARSLADIWHDVAYLSDDALEAQIRADQIDVLVDLSGHSAGNRLPVFARKPAPVQVTAWGSPAGPASKPSSTSWQIRSRSRRRARAIRRTGGEPAQRADLRGARLHAAGDAGTGPTARVRDVRRLQPPRQDLVQHARGLGSHAPRRAGLTVDREDAPRPGRSSLPTARRGSGGARRCP